MAERHDMQNSANKMEQIQSSPTLNFHKKIRELVKRHARIISLGLGESECGTSAHIVEAGVKAIKDGLTRYSAAPGLLILREKIAEKLGRDNNIKTDAANIIVTPGAKNALFIACMSILEPGDEVINIRPCYVSNNPILCLANENIEVHNVNMTRSSFNLNYQEIEKKVNSKTKLIFLNYPNNPTGRLLSAKEFEFLTKLVESNNLYVLSDEVYEKIVFGKTKHRSLGAIECIKDKVITVNGFSKAYFMTGWRIGYVNANLDMISNMLKIHEHINTNTPVFTQKAALAALEGPHDDLDSYIEKLKKRKDIYDNILSASDVLTGSNAEGGYFAFLDISKSGLKSDAFATTLLERTGVAVIPGVSFGTCFDNYCRVSFVNHTELFAEGLGKIENMVKDLANGK